MERKHIYSVSFGKDSLAMLLMAIDKGLPIDEVVFFNILELDPTQYEYVAFGEYPAGVIEEITDQTGYYGEIYRFCYCAAQMALEKMNPRT